MSKGDIDMEMEHPKRCRAVIYARVSTGSEQQETSLAAQELDDENSFFDDFKKKYKYEVYHTFTDDTSATTDNRRGYNEMLAFFGIERLEVITGKNLPNGNIERDTTFVYKVNEERLQYVKDELDINYIFCKNTSRFTRSANFQIIADLRAKGIYIYFKDENIDTFNIGTDTLLGIMQHLDRSKSTDTSIKVKSGFEVSIAQGHIRTNSAIYGYSLVRRQGTQLTRLVSIPEEAEVIKEIFRLYVGYYQDENGNPIFYGSRQISNILRERGIVTREKTTKKDKKIGNKPFSISSIKRILSNEKYAGYVNVERKWDSGEVFYHKSPKKLYGYKIEKSDLIENPPIDIDTFLEAQKICESRSEKTSQRGRNTGNSIYYGKVKCGLCGYNYTQNGERNAKGEYIKKLNCSGKKKHSLSFCNNRNISFVQIEELYKSLHENFEDFLRKEKQRNKTIILTLLSCYERIINPVVIPEILQDDGFSVTISGEAKASNYEQTIIDLKKQYEKEIKGIMDKVKAFATAPAIVLEFNKEVEKLQNKIAQIDVLIDEQDKKKNIYFSYIQKLQNDLQECERIDIDYNYTLEEIKKFDIMLYVYPDRVEFKLNIVNLDYYLKDEQIKKQYTIITEKKEEWQNQLRNTSFFAPLFEEWETTGRI